LVAAWMFIWATTFDHAPLAGALLAVVTLAVGALPVCGWHWLHTASVHPPTPYHRTFRTLPVSR
jgi:hypothetical protein